MALAQYRPDVSSYFASMSPLAGRIMAALEDGEEIIQDDVTRLYERSSRGPPALEVTTEVSVFPKFVPDPTRKIIVDEQDGKTWEDEYSGQFSWETRSQLELDFSSFEDVSSGVTPGVPRRRLESGDVDGAASPVASVASPSNGKGVRKAKLVTNWLDSPVLKAMQENSSNSDGFEDGPSRETSPEAQPKSDSDPDSADLFSKFGITFTLGPGNESTTDEAISRRRSPSPIHHPATYPSDSPIRRSPSKKHRRSQRQSGIGNDVERTSSNFDVPFNASKHDATPSRQHQTSPRDELSPQKIVGPSPTNQLTNLPVNQPVNQPAFRTELSLSEFRVGREDEEEKEIAEPEMTSMKTGFDFLDNW